MRRVTAVKLYRAEGYTDDPEQGHWFEHPDFDSANQRLARWATSAPNTGGYDKCDFVVVYDNNAEDDAYEGRFDLQYEHTRGGRLLQEHMEAFVLWYWGLHTRDRDTGELVKT